MRVYMFHSWLKDAAYAFDRNIMGASLPQEHAPWRPVAQSMSFSVDDLSPEVQDAIRRDGFCVLRAHNP
jgi:hypothetical protein